MNAKLYYNRALVRSKIGKSQDAISDCTSALEIDSNYMKALLLRARCHKDIENFEDCVKDYETALKQEKTPEIRNALREAKLLLKKSKRKDYYKILGVSKNASDDEIKKAYRKRALSYHPDRHVNATDEEKKETEKKFKEVGEAYAVLSDPQKKARYDSGQDLDDMDHMGKHDFIIVIRVNIINFCFTIADFDPSQMFRQYFSFSGGQGFDFTFQ